jgi:Terminase large subunit, T4likevirus-type, N-terminal
VVVSLASVDKRIAALEKAGCSETIPESVVEFARRAGLENLDDWQEELLLSQSPRILLNITRQGGKSTMSGVLAVHKALSTPRSLVLILAPSERQAKETFARAAALYRHDIPADSYRKLGMELANGSRIEALPGTEKTVRGYSGVDLLILDEASRVADELYYAMRPTLAVSGGRLLMMSTPYGKRGVFYEEWIDGVGWERYEVPASECPRIPAAFLEEERKALPARVYRQEYCNSFEDVDDVVFAYEDVQAAISSEVTPLFGEAS